MNNNNNNNSIIIDKVKINKQIDLPNENNSIDVKGNLRRNTALNNLQYYNGSNWVDIDISTGINLWESSGGLLQPISPYVGVKVDSISEKTTSAGITLNNQLNVNSISSIAGDDDLNFNTSGSGRYIFNIQSSPSINPGRVQWLAPDILTAGGEVDFYLGGSVSPANFSIFGYGHNASSFNSCYTYFGLLSTVGGSCDRRMRIYGSGECQMPNALRLISGANFYCDNIYPATSTTPFTFNANTSNADAFKIYSSGSSTYLINRIGASDTDNIKFINNYSAGEYTISTITSSVETVLGKFTKTKLQTPNQYYEGKGIVFLQDYTNMPSAEASFGYNFTSHELMFHNGTAWKSLSTYTLAQKNDINDISTSKIYCDKIYPKNKTLEICGLKIGTDTSGEKHILAQDENGIYYINSKGLKCYFAVNEMDKDGKKNNPYGVDNITYKYLCKKWKEFREINEALSARISKLEAIIEEKFIEKKIEESKKDGELGNSLLLT